MRRRRRSNPLLGKMMLVSVLVTACLVPLMAYFGLFKSVPARYYQVSLINEPPPPPPPPLAKQHREPPKVRPHSTTHNGAMKSASKAAPLPVHVQAASNGGTADDNNAIQNGQNTALGQVPVAPRNTVQTPAPAPAPAPVAPAAPVKIAQVPLPPPPPSVVAPHAPTLIEPSLVYGPKPTIPDDLLGSDLDTTLQAVFTVHANGNVDVKLLKSSGNEELDSIALGTAKTWKFSPATLDGKPVEQQVRLNVEFQVQ